MIRVGVLTSSRADYGIYLPLLKALNSDPAFELRLIVFGTHLSKFHGYTLEEIERDGFEISAQIESLLLGDTPNAIASAFGLTALKFSDFWNTHKIDFDVIFALGDRFEMAAAVLAAVPFGIPIAHLHGGETTLGAIDNIYRHTISLSAKYHFTSTTNFAERINALLNNQEAIIEVVGSLSLENLQQLNLLTIPEFKEKWNIDLTTETILITVHPETVDFQKNEQYAVQTFNALKNLANSYQLVITMPNADTAGLIYREKFLNLANQFSSVKIIENFGTQSYFTCMKYAKLLIGNTSSGIIEAASFNKYVINLGDRQKGRLCSPNIINIPFDENAIVEKTKQFITQIYSGENIYFKENPSQIVVNRLKKIYGTL
ncbi:UDP-N-acetylglucosamine 2-epimerase [Bacteroidota bacterium]